METKKFAEENAGKFFRFHNEIVKVVGYSKENRGGVLVSGHSCGWDSQYSGVPITFVCRSRGEKLWWVTIYQLQPITDEEFDTEFLRENVGKFFMYGGERCRLVGAEKDAVNPYLVIETRNGWLAKFDRLAQMWDGKVERCLYVTKDQLIPIRDVSARQFVEDNAGRYYTFEGARVRAVGYHQNHVIVTHKKGWYCLDPEDKFTCETKAKRFWYVTVDSLKEIPLW